MMRRYEQEIQKAIIHYLDLKKYLYVVPDTGVNVQNERTRRILWCMGRRAGAPDIIVFVNNGTVCLEVKRPKIGDRAKGVQSARQKRWEEMLNAKLTGHKYKLVYSLEDAIEELK